MSAATLTTTPGLRRLAVPVAEPRPALRVVPDTDTDPPTVPAINPAMNPAIDPAIDRTPATATGRGSRPGVRGRGHLAGEAARRPLLQDAQEPRDDMPARPLRTTPPPPTAWARQFVQTALEAAAGRRPVSQLLRWSSEDVYALLLRRAALATRRDRGGSLAVNCSVRSVHLRPLGAGVVEACAVISERGRFRAVALRLEDTRGRWRVTALEIG